VSALCITCGSRPRRHGAGQRRCNRCAHRREDPEKKRRRDKESYRRRREKIGPDEWRRRARESYRVSHPKPLRLGRRGITRGEARGNRWQRRLLAIAALGGKCEMCGIDDPDVLQFDHRIPVGSKKRRGLNGKAASHKTVSEILGMNHAEIQFALLCANCHVKKTRYNGDYMAQPDEREQDNRMESEHPPTPQLSLFDERRAQKHASGSFQERNPRVTGDRDLFDVGDV